jgi:hypothetical protein
MYLDITEFIYFILATSIFCIIASFIITLQWVREYHKEGKSWKKAIILAIKHYFGLDI